MIHGSCLCGAIAWRLDGALELINLCHGSICRRFTGSAYGASGHALSQGFAFIQGEAGITRYTSSPGNEASGPASTSSSPRVRRATPCKTSATTPSSIAAA